MNLLVTGGAGFIGSNLMRLVIDRAGVDKLINLDALTYAGNLRNLDGIHDTHPRYRFEHADLRDAASVHRIIAEHDITHVIHLAAESHVDRSIQSAGVFMETNVLGTLNLLDACRAHWGKGKENRFIQVSTDEVYGSLGPEEAPFTEESPLLPNSPYAASKAAADCLVRSYIQTYGFPAIITRCCNNYGPNQHPEKFIPTILNCLRDRKPIPIYGDGQQVREWIHVSDHVEALWQVLHKGESSEVYNIGSGEERTNLELAEMLCNLYDEAKRNSAGSSCGLITHVVDRPGHDVRYAVEGQKMKVRLEWKPSMFCTKGMRDVVSRL